MAAFESKKYAWRKGYSYRVPAATVGSVLEKIEKEEGSVTSEKFLDYSRNEEAETHTLFEWDDSIAAEKYRLAQAGKIINQLDVTLEYKDQEPEAMELEVATRSTTVSAFMNITPRTPTSKATFMNAERAMSGEDTRRQVLLNALQELWAFERKYKAYKEFNDLFDAIGRISNEIQKTES